MGADFLVWYVYWHEDTELDFSAADKLIEALTHKQVEEVFDNSSNEDLSTPFLLGYEPQEGNPQEEPIYDLDRVKSKLRQALAIVKDPYSVDNTGKVKIGPYHQILVAGMSWGDSFPEADLLELLSEFKDVSNALGLL